MNLKKELQEHVKKKYRALQVPARHRVRGRAAAHRDRKTAALQIEDAMMQILQPPGWAKPRAIQTALR